MQSDLLSRMHRKQSIIDDKGKGKRKRKKKKEDGVGDVNESRIVK